ncbi:hypothetical protein M6B38_106260 [Iris pallida]|uniref:Uncharacterized protein n=1 Tax=Iris pallida TaxID=29817 RepID=A0AAX6ESD4_IRIPA|nr:hypothetical protein M6B38_106260 [Iris pallida]
MGEVLVRSHRYISYMWLVHKICNRAMAAVRVFRSDPLTSDGRVNIRMDSAYCSRRRSDYIRRRSCRSSNCLALRSLRCSRSLGSHGRWMKKENEERSWQQGIQAKKGGKEIPKS